MSIGSRSGWRFAEVLATGVAWASAGVFFGILNGIDEGWGFGAMIAAAGWLGGETTCALYYLLLERALRPVTALALASRAPDKPVAPGVTDRLLFAWSLGTGVPILGVIVVGVVGATGRRRSGTSPRPASSSASSPAPSACWRPSSSPARSPIP